MKFSTWAKRRGHVAGWDIEDPDYILISCIFRKNRDKIMDGHRWFNPNAQIIAGGPGWNPSITLPREIERCPPDYSLYPKYEDSVGFVTQGCRRKCYYCIVPKMPPIRFIQPVSAFYRGGVCNIMDDNILFLPERFKEAANYLIDNKIKTHFEYLDIRLVTEEIAGLLGEIKHRRRMKKGEIDSGDIHFAYDITDENTEVAIERNVGILNDVGLKGRKLKFYIYIHSDDEKDIIDAAHRWEFIRGLGSDVHGMPNIENVKDEYITRNVKREGIWRKLTTAEVFGIKEGVLP